MATFQTYPERNIQQFICQIEIGTLVREANYTMQTDNNNLLRQQTNTKNPTNRTIDSFKDYSIHRSIRNLGNECFFYGGHCWFSDGMVSICRWFQLQLHNVIGKNHQIYGLTFAIPQLPVDSENASPIYYLLSQSITIGTTHGHVFELNFLFVLFCEIFSNPFVSVRTIVRGCVVRRYT